MHCKSESMFITNVSYGSRDKRIYARQLKEACDGKQICCFPVKNENFDKDPCPGALKYLTAEVNGCEPIIRETQKERRCKLSGHALDAKDILYLSRIQFPKPKLKAKCVAVYIDTTWRPRLQKFVVENVAQHTGWPIQIFHGLRNENKMKRLFSNNSFHFTPLMTDDMSWYRLSSLMLLSTFWRACIGDYILIFQPDSIMCSNSEVHINDFLKYDYVGAPMAGQWWSTTDEKSGWTVGCGGFSLRRRTQMIRMTRSAQCTTPSAGKLEDQQLSLGWSYIQKRCADVDLHVYKPNRHLAAKFAIEYDLFMDKLPGEDPLLF